MIYRTVLDVLIELKAIALIIFVFLSAQTFFYESLSDLDPHLPVILETPELSMTYQGCLHCTNFQWTRMALPICNVHLP